MIQYLVIFIGKTIIWFSKILNLGSGSTWPGHIALALNKNFIKEFFLNSKTQVIFVAGTNGKTTTSTILSFILKKEGKRVFQNEEGANLLNGIASAIIRNTPIMRKVSYDYAIFELDENVLPLALNKITPQALILLNLFRDQLDRYGEVNTIALKWKNALVELPDKTTVILNGDDPQIAFLGKKMRAKIEYFGIDQSLMKIKEIPHDVDSIYCLECGRKLNYQSIAYSHLGDYVCEGCGLKRPETNTFISKNLTYPLKGIYNIYNINAVILLLTKVLSIKLDKIQASLKLFKPAFGRQEIITYKGKTIHLLLSKNPAGFNQSIEAVKEIVNERKMNFLIVLNNRIADGRDVSWIWDVDFEKIQDLRGLSIGFARIIVSGDRAYDMGLRLKYAEINDVVIEENLEKAISKTIENVEEVIILATYTGMLEVRKTLLGRKLL